MRWLTGRVKGKTDRQPGRNPWVQGNSQASAESPKLARPRSCRTRWRTLPPRGSALRNTLIQPVRLSLVETNRRLQLSEEKTKLTTYGKGYEFLGFRLSKQSRRMRDKSERKFKDKVRSMTIRHHNLDKNAVERLNRVIRGTANYFATEFATQRWRFQKLDSWIRMRIRCMKYKRKNYNDNRKLRARTMARKLGLLSLEGFCKYLDAHGKLSYATPRNGAMAVGVAR